MRIGNMVKRTYHSFNDMEVGDSAIITAVSQDSVELDAYAGSHLKKNLKLINTKDVLDDLVDDLISKLLKGKE